MLKILLLISIFLAIGVSSSIYAQSNNTKELENLFGKSVDRLTDVFQYNESYVIRIARNDEVITLAEIVPKYYFYEEVSEWKKPESLVELTEFQIEDFLKRVNSIKQIGKSVKIAAFGTVNNLKFTYWERYENAFIKIVMNSTDNLPGTKKSFLSFSVYFNHAIDGKIDEQIKVSMGNNIYFTKVFIDGCSYWAINDSIENGFKGKIDVAGPLNTGCSIK